MPAPPDQIHGEDRGTGRTPRGLQGPLAHCGVAIDPGQHVGCCGCRLFDHAHIGRIVNPGQLREGDKWRVIVGDQHLHPGRDEPVFDRVQALRRFRVVGAHMVVLARVVAYEGEAHCRYLSA